MEEATIHRIRIILNLLAFFFAAPEILGENRIKWLEGLVEKLGYRIGTFLSGDTRWGIAIGSFWIMLGIFVLILAKLDVKRLREEQVVDSETIERLAVAYSFCIFAVILILYLGLSLLVNGVNKLLLILANDQNIRRRSLLFGVILFLLSTTIEVIFP